MKSLSLKAHQTLDNSFDRSNFASLNSTMTLDVQSQVTQKFKTFTRWNYRKEIRKKKKNVFQQSIRERSDTNNMINILLAFTNNLKKKEEDHKKKNVLKVEQLEGVKAERRERFKKVQNPMHLIQHYMTKQGFKPNEQENILLDKIVKLKEFIDQNQPLQLDIVLKKIYKIMNSAVDLNEMRFLILSILLAGQICFECKEMVRSFHFYTQAMIAATCTRMNTLKIQCFMQMGRIAMEILEYQKAIKFLKKALQYSWKVKESQVQLRIYDLLGQAYYYEGQAGYAQYYHNRYIQGELEDTESATRRISFEMLCEFEKTLQNTQKENITQLFIEYLTLPIADFTVFPPAKIEKAKVNYINNHSPRKGKQFRNFGPDDLPNALTQIDKMLKNFSEFFTQIPNPDIQRNFVATQKFGRPRKDLDFEQSNEYHKIMGIKPKKCDPDVFKLPINQRISRALSQKQNPHWWENMVSQTKKERQQKLGQLRDKVKKTHMSYHKYPEERRRSLSLKNQKIKESINTTILNWIDPPKEKLL